MSDIEKESADNRVVGKIESVIDNSVIAIVSKNEILQDVFFNELTYLTLHMTLSQLLDLCDQFSDNIDHILQDMNNILEERKNK